MHKEPTRNTQDQKKKKKKKRRGNRQTVWKIIQNNDSKMFQNLKNRMEKIQIAINRIKIITKNI